MDNRSLSRELSLISLGLVNEEITKQAFELTNLSLDTVLESAIFVLEQKVHLKLQRSVGLIINSI